MCPCITKEFKVRLPGHRKKQNKNRLKGNANETRDEKGYRTASSGSCGNRSWWPLRLKKEKRMPCWYRYMSMLANVVCSASLPSRRISLYSAMLVSLFIYSSILFFVFCFEFSEITINLKIYIYFGFVCVLSQAIRCKDNWGGPVTLPARDV